MAILLLKSQQPRTSIICPLNNNISFNLAIMSPHTQEIQDYLQKLSSTVNKLPKTYTLAAKPTFKALLGIFSPSTAVSPPALVELLTNWLLVPSNAGC